MNFRRGRNVTKGRNGVQPLGLQMQLDLAEECSAIYVDGTFKCVKDPYKQLFSIHSFLRSGENIKQVPLVNIIVQKNED